MRSVKAAIVGGAVLVTTVLAAVPATAAPTDDVPTTSVAAPAGAETSVADPINAALLVSVVVPNISIGAVVSVPGIIAVGLSLAG